MTSHELMSATKTTMPVAVPELLLFDLGGVLVDFSGIRDLPRFMRRQKSTAEVRRAWIDCRIVRAFEAGALTPARFAERFVEEWELSLSAEDFLQEFRQWTRGLLPGAAEMLTALHARFRLACLSNSNPAHWDRNREIALFDYFDVTLSSHLLGCHKPEPLIYERALAILDVRPEAIAFFDDIAENVDGARTAGMRAFEVSGIAELRACLTEQGWL
ncbi:MAG: HAD family phosphatase [Acidobacteriota bacterium]